MLVIRLLDGVNGTKDLDGNYVLSGLERDLGLARQKLVTQEKGFREHLLSDFLGLFIKGLKHCALDRDVKMTFR